MSHSLDIGEAREECLAPEFVNLKLDTKSCYFMHSAARRNWTASHRPYNTISPAILLFALIGKCSRGRNVQHSGLDTQLTLCGLPRSAMTGLITIRSIEIPDIGRLPTCMLSTEAQRWVFQG